MYLPDKIEIEKMDFWNDIHSALRRLPSKGQRNLLKILSLGTGLAVGLVLCSKVCFEQTFDDFFDGAQRIFRIGEAYEQSGEYRVYNQTSGGIAPRLKEYFPQIEHATRFTWFELDARLVLHGTGERVKAGKAGFTDSAFFQILDRKCVAGDIKEGLTVKGNAVISESVARRIAATKTATGKVSAEDALGQQFTVAGWTGAGEVTVSGVFEDFPLNSTYRPDVLISMPTLGMFIYDGSDGVVGNDRYITLIKLNPGTDIESIKEDIGGFINTYLPVDEIKAAGFRMDFMPMGLADIHNSDSDRRNMTLLLAFVAFALLLTSVLNYLLIVLSTSVTRSREMALRKCLGSGRGDTARMMFAEALVHTLLSCALAALLIFLFRSSVEEILGVEVTALFRGRPLALAVGIVIILLSLNAFVPAWFFNRIPVAAAFRGYSENRRRWKLGLLAAEFAAVSFLAVVLIVISLQYRKMSAEDLGFDYSDLAMIDISELSDGEKNALFDEILTLSDVEDAAMSFQNPFEIYSGNNISIPGDDRQLFNVRDAECVSGNWFKVMGVDIIEGRDFDPSLAADNEMIVDRKFVEKMKNTAGWDDVLGREVNITGHRGPVRICGIFDRMAQPSFSVDDEFFSGRPTVFFHCNREGAAWMLYCLFIRYHSLTPEALKHTQEAADRLLPSQEIEVMPCRKMALEYISETKGTRDAVLAGGVVSLIIALLGLIGYTADEVRRRGKEIAVRRVCGAQFSQIRAMFLGDVMLVAVPSAVLGCVLAGIAAARWEQQFTVQAGLPWWVFAAVLPTVLATVAIVSDIYVQMVAHRNPSESIRTE